MEKLAEIILPPSPNWYSSAAIDCHRKTGVLAYAASRCLVVVWPEKTTDEHVTFPKTRVISDSHRQKITCKFIILYYTHIDLQYLFKLTYIPVHIPRCFMVSGE